MVSMSTPTSVSGMVVSQTTKKTRFSRTYQQLLSWSPQTNERTAVICLQPGQSDANYNPYPLENGAYEVIGTPFPTAPPTASQYNMWRFVRPPKLHFVTNLNFGQQAQLRVGYNPDPRAPFRLQFDALSVLDGTLSVPANLNSCYTVKADTNWRYVNTRATADIDPRWTDAGIVYIATQGLSGVKILTVYWDYEIEFAQFVGELNPNAPDQGSNNDATRGHMTVLRDTTVNHVIPAGGLMPLGVFAPDSLGDSLENQLQIRPVTVPPNDPLQNDGGVVVTRPGVVCAVYSFIPALEGLTSTTIRMLKNGVEAAAKFLPTFTQGSEYSISCILSVAAGDIITMVCDNPAWTATAAQLLLTAL